MEVIGTNSTVSYKKKLITLLARQLYLRGNNCMCNKVELTVSKNKKKKGGADFQALPLPLFKR